MRHFSTAANRLPFSLRGLLPRLTVYTVGQQLLCAIKNRDEQDRIVLTLRELLGTWSENAACFAAGETVVGIVRSVEDYGVFIEIAPNLAGLAEPDTAPAPRPDGERVY